MVPEWKHDYIVLTTLACGVINCSFVFLLFFHGRFTLLVLLSVGWFGQ